MPNEQVKPTASDCSTKATKRVTPELKAKLVKGLEILPEDFVLTPVKEDKKPYRNNWQHETAMTRQQLADAIQNRDRVEYEGKPYTVQPLGYGLRTGVISNGIIAVDADGHAAHEKLNEISQGGLPLTVVFTSGKPGRCQYLYRIPEHYWQAIATKKLGTGVKGGDGKEQKLELRWNGCQSVLPPSVHPETGEYKWVNSPEDTAIAQAPQWLIEAMLKEHKPAKAERKSNSAKPKLDIETKSQHQLVREFKLAIEYVNALKPERADNYDEWMKVGMTLHSLANDPDLDPETSEEWNDKLFEVWDKWSQQSSKYDGGTESKWASFSEGKGVTIGSLGQMAKEDGWVRKNSHAKPGVEEKDELVQTFVTELEKIQKSSLDQSEKRASVIALRQRLRLNHWDVKDIAEDIDEKIEWEEERESNALAIQDLLSCESERFDISLALNPILAKPIKLLAENMGVREECLLMGLIGGISGQHNVKTRLLVMPRTNWKESPNGYVVFVAESTAKKSPSLVQMIDYPLGVIQNEIEEDYKRKKAAWDKDAEANKKNNVTPPIVREVVMCDLTIETIGEHFQSHPDKGLTIWRDELKGLFQDFGKYSNGKGSDRQQWLTMADGGAIRVKRLGRRVSVSESLVSLIGAIQPNVLKGIMNDCKDDDGFWARFMFVSQPTVAHETDEDSPYYSTSGVDLSHLLVSVYKNVQALPAALYKFNQKSYKLFLAFYNLCERQKANEREKPTLRKVWGKLPRCLAKLITNLHVLWYVAEGKTPPETIAPETVLAAIRLAKFLFSQVAVIHGDFTRDNDNIQSHILKVLKTAQKKAEKGVEWIKVSDVRQPLSDKQKKQWNADVIKEWLREAAKMNLGELRELRAGSPEFKIKAGVNKPRDLFLDIINRFPEHFLLANLPEGLPFICVDALESKPAAPQFNVSPELDAKCTDAEEDQEFVFSEPKYANNPDLQLATPKGSDREPEQASQSLTLQAVAGVSEAVEAEAIEVEEAATGSSFQEISGRFLEKLKSATASQSNLEQADACDQEKEPETVTVDSKTFSIGEVVKRTEHDIAVKVKVLGKGLIGNSQTEGFVVEYLETKIDPNAQVEGGECNHIQGGEWIVSAGQVRTTGAEFLSKLTDEDLATPDNTKQEKLINIQGNNLMPGAMIYYKPSTDEAAYVELLGESGTGEIIILCTATALEDSKCPFRVGDIAWVQRSTLSILPF